MEPVTIAHSDENVAFVPLSVDRVATIPRLRALTSLRFVAAAMIVVFHSSGYFGFPANLGTPFLLAQGVSFFFVLSGFILMYVYPLLNGPERWRFLYARFARLWPAHIAATLLFVLLLPDTARANWSFSPFTVFANLALIQAWIPIRKFAFSLNGVSWSISAEFGFYLFFLVFSHNWRHTWHFKLLLSGALTGMLIVLSNRLALPYDTSWTDNSISIASLIVTNPLTRLFEFTLGMTAALGWRVVRQKREWNRISGTCLEVAAIAIVVISMYITTPLARSLPVLGASGPLWLGDGGSVALAFAALILVMALERGRISQFLALPPLVLLGELSFSIYLIHLTFIVSYDHYRQAFHGIPNGVAYAVFWLITLLTAYLLWRLIEQPCRQFLLRLWPRERSTPVAPSRRQRPAYRRGTVAAGVALIVLLLPILLVGKYRSSVVPITSQEAQAVAIGGVPYAREVRFGDQFVLKGTRMTQSGTGINMEFAWESTIRTPLRYLVDLQFVDVVGTVLGQTAYPQDTARSTMQPGIAWREVVPISADQLRGAKAIAVLLLDPQTNTTLLVDRGPRDSDNHRLLISLAPTTDAEVMPGHSEGYVDAWTCDSVSGWAWDSSHPNEPVTIEIYDGDALLTTAQAYVFRTDLFLLGKGDGNHAFVIPLHMNPETGKPHTLHARIAETGVSLHAIAPLACSS